MHLIRDCLFSMVLIVLLTGAQTRPGIAESAIGSGMISTKFSFNDWLAMARAGELTAQQYLITKLRYENSDWPENWEAVPEWLRQSAERGDKEAKHVLGNAHKLGWGTPINLQKAFNWYAKASASGNMDAYWAGNHLWVDHRDVKGGPIPVNESFYGKTSGYMRNGVIIDIIFAGRRKCAGGSNLGVRGATGVIVCQSDVDEALLHLNDKLRHVSKYPVCLPDGIQKEAIYSAVRRRLEVLGEHLPKPPDDPREAFFYERKLTWSSEHTIAELLSKAFPC
ncbi:MAG: sel1 repeat family protein [Rhodospirillaceae bacterium]|nr:sel1 repeat family protein [Rhodospirillaceae bacterium]